MYIKLRKFFYRHKVTTVTAVLLLLIVIFYATIVAISYIKINAPSNITNNSFSASKTMVYVQKSESDRMDNTLMYYQNILQNNNSYSVDGFEIDLFISKDDKLVVSSYDKLDDISNSTLPPFSEKNVYISSKNIGELKQYNIAYNILVNGEYIYRKSDTDLTYARIITLDELLNYLKSQSVIWKKTFKLIINIDNKNCERIIPTLNAVLSLYNYSDYCVIVAKSNTVKKLIEYPLLKRTATPAETIAFFYSAALNIKNTNANYSLLYLKNWNYGINFGKKRFVSYANYLGVPLVYSNINTARKLNKVTSLAPNGISGSIPKEIYLSTLK